MNQTMSRRFTATHLSDRVLGSHSGQRMLALAMVVPIFGLEPSLIDKGILTGITLACLLIYWWPFSRC